MCPKIVHQIERCLKKKKMRPMVRKLSSNNERIPFKTWSHYHTGSPISPQIVTWSQKRVYFSSYDIPDQGIPGSPQPPPPPQAQEVGRGTEEEEEEEEPEPMIIISDTTVPGQTGAIAGGSLIQLNADGTVFQSAEGERYCLSPLHIWKKECKPFRSNVSIDVCIHIFSSGRDRSIQYESPFIVEQP